jgi:hypothetical protein
VTEFLIDGRGSGKSHAALMWMRGAGNRRLVVADSLQVDNLRRMEDEYASRKGVSKTYLQDMIIPYASIRNGRYMPQTAELGVDNLDMLLRQIFGADVGFVTATGSLHSYAPRVNEITIGGSE